MLGHPLISAAGALIRIVGARAAAHKDFFSPAADTGVGSDQKGNGLLAHNANQVNLAPSAISISALGWRGIPTRLLHRQRPLTRNPHLVLYN